MSTKREKILAIAKQLFIEQGISGTTIANIASQAEIAKGSVYSYFKSKQDIVVALLNQSVEQSQEKLEALIADSEVKGKALLKHYIKLELGLMSEERALNQVITTDSSLTMNEDLLQFMQDFRGSYYQNQVKLITAAYGDDIADWRMDFLALINGALQEYGIYITLDNADLTLEHSAEVMAHGLDAALHSLMQSDLTPALSTDILPIYGEDKNVRHIAKAEKILAEMQVMMEKLDEKEQLVVRETLSLLGQQLEQTPNNPVLTRALIANLSPYSELHGLRIRLADVLDVQLI